ncbi:MAG: carbamoyl transferase [Thermococci archaeon]|nr:carbamoyl transferase [Thermococci archaeon]
MEDVVLGIHDGHDAGAALITDDAVYAVNEERLNRVKKYRGFPSLSVELVLRMARLEPDDVDHIAVAGIFRRRKRLLELERNLRRVFGQDFKRKVLYVEHHLAHAAAAYYTSGERDTVALTIDAAGDGLSSTVYICRDGEMIRTAQSTYIDSLGDFYASVTEMLGFRPMRHEGKVMSLAAYGRPVYDLSGIIELSGLSFVNRLGVTGTEATRRLAEMFGYTAGIARETVKALKKGNLSGKNQKKAADIAASLQTHVERLLDELGMKLKGHGLPLVYSGGVAQNVKANAVLRRIFPDLWVFPAMDDGGLAFGAAIFVKSQLERLYGSWKPGRIEHVYLGPEYSDGDIESTVRGMGIAYEELPKSDVPSFVADGLDEGRIVGLFQGRMEFGPRALGNRSILADPRDRRTVGRLNSMLRRDAFQPFAPSILEELAGRYLEDLNGEPNRFMTMSYLASDELREAAPAVIHVDGTTRPQSVPEGLNRTYRNVLEEFRRRTGVGAVLNTSFNMHGEPIVCSPGDAVRSALSAKLDVTVMGSFIVYTGEGWATR